MKFLTLDLEATGLDPQTSRIIEITVVDDDGDPLISTLINPQQSIPDEVAKLTGINDGMMTEAKTFRDWAKLIAETLEHQTVLYYGGHHYDLPLLCAEFDRCGHRFDYLSVDWIDVGELFKILQPRRLSDAVRHYLGREHDGAHRASADATATGEVFVAMLSRDIATLRGKSPKDLALLSRHNKQLADPAGKLQWLEGRLCFGFGQYKGLPVETNWNYAEWMLARDFPESTKRLLRWEYERVRDAEGSVNVSEHPEPQQLEIPF